MEALIHITEREGQQVVDARELHSFLEVQHRFNDWIKNRIGQYEFVEGVDFIRTKNLVRSAGRFTSNEYALTITCAKELAMVEGNKKGKQARLYFIDCERRLKGDVLQRRITALEATVMLQQKQIDALLNRSPKKQLRLTAGPEALLVQKHFQPALPGAESVWTVNQVLSYLQQAEQQPKLNRYRIGKALTNLAGPRHCIWQDNRSQWVYDVSLTA